MIAYASWLASAGWWLSEANLVPLGLVFSASATCFAPPSFEASYARPRTSFPSPLSLMGGAHEGCSPLQHCPVEYLEERRTAHVWAETADVDYRVESLVCGSPFASAIILQKLQATIGSRMQSMVYGSLEQHHTVAPTPNAECSHVICDVKVGL